MTMLLPGLSDLPDWFDNNISVWKKGQQEKKEQAAKKKASKKDIDAGETCEAASKASVAEPEVIEIDWRSYDWHHK